MHNRRKLHRARFKHPPLSERELRIASLKPRSRSRSSSSPSHTVSKIAHHSRSPTGPGNQHVHQVFCRRTRPVEAATTLWGNPPTPAEDFAGQAASHPAWSRRRSSSHGLADAQFYTQCADTTRTIVLRARCHTEQILFCSALTGIQRAAARDLAFWAPVTLPLDLFLAPGKSDMTWP